MSESALRGVIAAISTPVEPNGEPDIARATKLARFLLDNGCDGLNVLGTTGEATSFSLAQRQKVMTAYREAGLPLDRLMVGTGAAAVADAVALTRHAADLGFAGALAGLAGIIHTCANRLSNPSDLVGAEIDVIGAVVLARRDDPRERREPGPR